MEVARLNKELLDQYILAGSDNSDPGTLRILAKHFCDKISLRVAENPRTPKEILRDLARDSNADVRVAVAGNPSTEKVVLVLLAKDNDIVVRHGMAQDLNTPKLILKELACDENGWVRGEALKTIELLDTRPSDEVARRRELRKTKLPESISYPSTDGEAAS